MKIAVRYQSRGGNTKTVAEAIAKAAGVEAEPITSPIIELVDILFVGGAIYAFGMDESLKKYLQDLDPQSVKSLAAFSTGGMMSIAKKIVAAAEKKGIAVCERTLSIKGMRGGTLTDEHTRQIEDFVKEILKA